MYASPTGYHRHRCSWCAFVYEHADCNDTHHNAAPLSHSCPACHRCGWGMGIYEGEEPPRVRNGLEPRGTSAHMANAPVPPDRSTGLIPRDYRLHPVGCFEFAPAFPDEELIPENEWQDRWTAQRGNSLLDLRNANYEILHSLDQNGFGLCWAFSTTKATMYLRAVANEVLLRLSAYWVAGRVKGWRDEGGWGAESLAKIVAEGAPVEALCPTYRSSNDTAETRANAAFHKVTEWWDGSDSVEQATKQMISSLLRNIPCVVDLNDMGHSMCAIDIERLNPLTIIYDNSWGSSGDRGLYRGTGARARPDGLVVPRVTRPSQS